MDCIHYSVVYRINERIIDAMLEIDEQRRSLSELGMRLKSLRLARNDTMAVFAERLGVSAGTLRAMEHGTATVNIGVWIRALWVLAQKASLLEQARAPRHRGRQRASRRPNRSRAIQI